MVINTISARGKLMKKEAVMNIYGDSVMKGVVIDETYRYHAKMQNEFNALEHILGMSINNKSRFGINSDKGRRILQKDMESEAACDYMLIEFGGNDCNFKWDEIEKSPDEVHVPQVEIGRFRENYLYMIKKIKQKGIVPILMNLPPIDAEKYLAYISRSAGSVGNILKWLGDAQTIYRFHEMYSNEITKIAAQTNSVFIDIRSRFLNLHNFSELIGLDGIHPSVKGYKLMFEGFTEFAKNKSAFQPSF